jgi:hypothetical protein
MCRFFSVGDLKELKATERVQGEQKTLERPKEQMTLDQRDAKM